MSRAGPPSLERSAAGLLAVVCTLVVIAAVPQLSRRGYSPDEEFTVFAVRGIAATSLPLLPSNLLYDRGLAYSYASWAAGALSGVELPAFRAIALISMLGSLVLVFRIVQRHASDATAIVAIVLLATSIPFWAAATSGRFYSPFLLLYLCTLSTLGTFTLGTSSSLGTNPLGTLGTIRTLGTLPLLALLARLSHELAFTLALLPALCFLLSTRGARARWLLPAIGICAGLALAQEGIFALHYLAPSSGETMIKRFFLWQVINLFEVPPDRQFGIPLVVLVIAWLIAPQRARLNAVISLSVFALILSFSLTRALTGEPFSWSLVSRVFEEGSRYPLDMFWHIVRTTPVTISLAIALLIARLAGAGGEWRPIERAAHMLWVGWVLWFGVIESGITINYLLLPVSFMLVAIAVDLVAVVTHNIDLNRADGGSMVWTICVLAITAVVSDQWRGPGSIVDRLEAARPTIDVPAIAEIRDQLRPNDRVVCTDELGCLMLVGRIDVWLALDDYVRERFVVTRADGQLAGVYTGSPAVYRPADLFEGTPAERTLVVDVFKEYAVGNSRGWLPRALERDGIDARILLQTPQVRIVEISAPAQNARVDSGTLGESRRSASAAN